MSTCSLYSSSFSRHDTLLSFDFDVVPFGFYCSFSTSNMMILLELKIQFTFVVAKRKCSPIHCGKMVVRWLWALSVGTLCNGLSVLVYLSTEILSHESKKNNGLNTENTARRQ